MSKLKVSPGILDIAPYIPGRSTAAGGKRLIKVSSNETPLGTSPVAIEAVKRMAGYPHRYPHGPSLAVRDAIAARHGLEAERIICGNGSDELIGLLAMAYAGPGDEVLFTEYAFAIYKIAAQSNGATPVAVPEAGLTADVDALIERAGPDTRLCFLANPNNPTGTYIPADDVRRLRAGLPEQTLLVLDSAYAEYLSRDDYTDGIDLVDANDNVVTTRTFSKIFGLSALRLGWMYAPRGVADVINRIRLPFNINAAAQAAGIAAVQDTAFVDRAVAFNAEWMPWLERELTALGLQVHPSSANFVLAEFPEQPGRSADDAYQYLLSEGIIPRRLDNYGLPKCLRFSLGLEDENREIVAAVRTFLESNR
jgi:histidinol-phosphate aminotransferase